MLCVMPRTIAKVPAKLVQPSRTARRGGFNSSRNAACTSSAASVIFVVMSSMYVQAKRVLCFDVSMNRHSDPPPFDRIALEAAARSR